MLEKRDYTGAMTLLKFQKSTSTIDPLTNQWLAYAAFHNGDFELARKVSHNSNNIIISLICQLEYSIV